jgi:hypothetical protein
MGGEDGLDFRQLVEPGEEVLGQLAVLEAQVELLTDGKREAGDFCRCESLTISDLTARVKRGFAPLPLA